MEEDDLHGMSHHLDPHSQLMGPGMPRHSTPAYVSGHLMMDYDMGGHQAAPSYSVPHVLPGHPAPVMMLPMNAPTPQMPMQMVQERAPPKKRGRASAAMKDEIEGALGSSKKRSTPKRKKADGLRSAVAKRAAMGAPVMMQSNEMGVPMVGYMPNIQLAGFVRSNGEDEDPNASLLPPSTVMPNVARPRSADDSRAAQRSANALREYQRRAKETPPERAARRAANAARARQRRAEETPEERQRRLHREALRQQRRRDNETERERAARRAANALRQQERRAREAMQRQQAAQLREQMNNQQQQIQIPIPQVHEGHEDVSHIQGGHYMESAGDHAE
jgi:flagellar biosynthesis GTPase FlhF